MTNPELAERIKQLSAECEQSNPGASAVLMVLAGAVESGIETHLFDHIEPFVRQVVATMRQARDSQS
jgi:predicted amino acid racemase